MFLSERSRYPTQSFWLSIDEYGINTNKLSNVCGYSLCGLFFTLDRSILWSKIALYIFSSVIVYQKYYYNNVFLKNKVSSWLLWIIPFFTMTHEIIMIEIHNKIWVISLKFSNIINTHSTLSVLQTKHFIMCTNYNYMNKFNNLITMWTRVCGYTTSSAENQKGINAIYNNVLLRTRRALMLYNNVLLRTRRALTIYITMFCWEPEGH